MENVTLIMGSVFPVPAVKGGAVENLVENIVKCHEKKKKKQTKLNVICAYNKDAEKVANNNYKNTNFYFVKINKIYKLVDKIVSIFAAKVLRKKNIMAYSYIFQRLKYYKQISKLLHKNDFGNIVLENSTGLYLALKWKKNYIKYKNKYYYHCHNKVNMRFGCDKIIRKTENFISVSDYMNNDLKKFVGIDDEKRFITLKNIVDSSKFYKEITIKEVDEIRKKYNITPKDKIIIFAGRLTEEKGIKQLLMAIDKIKNKTFKVLVVGSYFFDTKVKNDFIWELNKLIDKNKEKIIFTGYVSYDDIYKFYKIASFAVLPSIWEEPAGLTVQEAELCGLPIITTDSGGIPEYVNSDNAIILKRDNQLVDNLRIEVENLLKDDRKIDKMKKASLELSKKVNMIEYYNKFVSIVKNSRKV